MLTEAYRCKVMLTEAYRSNIYDEACFTSVKPYFENVLNSI